MEEGDPLKKKPIGPSRTLHQGTENLFKIITR